MEISEAMNTVQKEKSKLENDISSLITDFAEKINIKGIDIYIEVINDMEMETAFAYVNVEVKI